MSLRVLGATRGDGCNESSDFDDSNSRISRAGQRGALGLATPAARLTTTAGLRSSPAVAELVIEKREALLLGFGIRRVFVACFRLGLRRLLFALVAQVFEYLLLFGSQHGLGL